MATIEHAIFQRRLARRLGEAGLRIARPKVTLASRTLGRAMYLSVRRARGRAVEARISIPHYWALYVHDGRKPFQKGSYMVWWRDPKQDPRRRPSGRTPQRRASLRQLNADEFRRAWQVRAEWLAAGGHPYDSPVIITKAVRKRTPPTPFFANDAGGGMAGFRAEAGRLARAEFSSYVKQFLGDAYKERDPAELFLR